MDETLYTIFLSPDEMEAWMIFHSTQPLSSDHLLTALQTHGIVFGIDQFFLQDLAEARQIGRAYQVAQGVAPEEGLEYFFPLHQNRKPRRLPDGQVDFHNLDTITNVIQQQILVTQIPASKRKPGRTVTGKEIAPTSKTISLPIAGENVALSDEGNALISLINGYPSLTGNVLSVSPTYTLEGDVDLSVGNLTCVGNLVVTGDVKSGFSIKCAQQVTIHGIVESADIHAGGSVRLHSNVFGKQKSSIKSAGQVQGIYVDSTRIEASEDILLLRGARHSQLHSGGSVMVQGPNGHIIGGRVQASGQIVTHDLGSENEVSTHVEILSDLFDPETSRLVLRHIAAVLEKDRKILGQSDELPAGKTSETITRLQRCQEALQDLYAYFEQRLQVLPLTPMQMGTIVATGTVYPGVTIRIGGVSLPITRPLTGVMFYKSKGSINMQPLEIPLQEIMQAS